MSNLNRLRALQEFCETEPENPFNWYALALEYQAGEPSKTEEIFDRLLTDFSDYLPTYYPAAHFFSDQEKTDKALTIFEKGIELAHSQGQTKTLGELNSALEIFKFENDLD